MRRLALFVLLLCSLAGCSTSKSKTIERVVAATGDWHEVSWGQPVPEEQREQQKVRLECVWDEIESAGGDPEQSLDCLARRMRVGAACQERIDLDDASLDAFASCQAEFESVCVIGAAFERASRTCS